MKLLSDVSTILKMALVCVVIGFVLGFLASGAVRADAPAPENPGPAAAVSTR